jgi:hypothetical protein
MLSGKLIHLIEAHSDQITSRVIHQIRHDPQLKHIPGLPDAELRETGAHILENLGHWLASPKEEELANRYEQLGRVRFEEDVPLHEAVRCLCILKEKMLDFIQDQEVSKTPLQLYAEEELDRRIGRFFDVLLVHLVHGYERALRRAAHVGAEPGAGGRR